MTWRTPRTSLLNRQSPSRNPLMATRKTGPDAVAGEAVAAVADEAGTNSATTAVTTARRAMAAAGEAESSAPAIEAAPSEDAERVYAPSLFEAAPVAAESTFVAEAAVVEEPEPEEVKAGAPEPEELASEPEPEEREPVAVVLTPPDPDRPKRAGWWSRAKSVISGS